MKGKNCNVLLSIKVEENLRKKASELGLSFSSYLRMLILKSIKGDNS
jgi:predicted DNA binding CopG/RHH family protein